MLHHLLVPETSKAWCSMQHATSRVHLCRKGVPPMPLRCQCIPGALHHLLEPTRLESRITQDRVCIFARRLQRLAWPDGPIVCFFACARWGLTCQGVTWTPKPEELGFDDMKYTWKPHDEMTITECMADVHGGCKGSADINPSGGWLTLEEAKVTTLLSSHTRPHLICMCPPISW